MSRSHKPPLPPSIRGEKRFLSAAHTFSGRPLSSTHRLPVHPSAHSKENSCWLGCPSPLSLPPPTGSLEMIAREAFFFFSLDVRRSADFFCQDFFSSVSKFVSDPGFRLTFKVPLLTPTPMYSFGLFKRWHPLFPSLVTTRQG